MKRPGEGKIFYVIYNNILKVYYVNDRNKAYHIYGEEIYPNIGKIIRAFLNGKYKSLKNRKITIKTMGLLKKDISRLEQKILTNYPNAKIKNLKINPSLS